MNEKIGEYLLLSKKGESPRSIYYQGMREADSQNVLLEFLKSKNPSPAEVTTVKQCYAQLKKLELSGSVRIFDFLLFRDSYVVIQEDAPGVPLTELMGKRPLSIERFLHLGIALAEALGALHQKKITHRGLKPANVLVDPAADRVKLRGFGISRLLTGEDEEFYSPDVIEDTLLYMSPEQTGRMNREIDYRTDFYSLGVIFYQMLTALVPFRSPDPMEVVHAHLARKPQSPREVNGDVPAVIADIVLKLIAKTAEARYQNSFGLAADLQECLRQIQATGQIQRFELGQKDIALCFKIPQALVGRGAELETLLGSFDRVARGAKEMMLVQGHPGIGKSALIHEIHKPVVARKGYFIFGKFDQFKRDVPYSGIIQAFMDLMKGILLESEERISAWAELIGLAVGDNGRVLTDMIPYLEYVIGPQPEVPELGGEASRNRLNHVFRQFAGVLADSEHPLVLFLDDLQWADSASLKLLRALIRDPDLKHFYFIGAYRENEVDALHPLALTIEELVREGVEARRICLGPIQVDDVNAMVSSFLRCKGEQSLPLAQIIHQKTAGNPFFINQFIMALNELGLLILSEQGRWVWDFEKVSGMRVTDNVVLLMVDKISRLPAKVQVVMKLCACIGNRFELEVISAIQGVSLAEALENLQVAIDEGLVHQEGDLYRFHHDRIHEAAYSLIEPREREELHQRIGRYVLANTKEDELEGKILYIVNHMNAAQGRLESSTEKLALAELNLRAANKSRKSSAYESCYKYLCTALDLIPDRTDHACWERNYGLLLALSTQAAEAAYLLGDYAGMERHASAVLLSARSNLDKMAVYETRIQTNNARGDLQGAIAVGLEALALMGLRFPRRASNPALFWSLFKSKWAMLGRSVESLLDLPQMSDPGIRATIRIMEKLSISAYLAKPRLAALIAFETLPLLVKHGNDTFSPYALTSYGFCLSIIGQYDSGYQFGILGLRLVEKTRAPDRGARATYVFHGLLAYYKEHLRKSIEPLQQNHNRALTVGDLDIAALSLLTCCSHAYFVGTNLEALDEMLRKHLQALGRIKHESAFQVTLANHQIIKRLLSRPDEPAGDGVQRPAEGRPRVPKVHHFYMMFFHYLLQQLPEALEQSRLARKYLGGMISLFQVPQYFFYDSLIHLALLGLRHHETPRDSLSIVQRNQKKLKRFTTHAPMNFLHKYLLVEAERLRVARKPKPAVEAYEKSIWLAKENGYLQDEGLAHELLGRFRMARGERQEATNHLMAARTCYANWGATAKLLQMEMKYAEILKDRS